MADNKGGRPPAQPNPQPRPVPGNDSGKRNDGAISFDRPPPPRPSGPSKK